VVHVIRSGSGGYSQGGPNVSGERGVSAASQTSYINNWLTWYPGLKVPTVPDTGALPTRVLDAINSVLPTGWSEARSTVATYWNSSSVESTASSNVLRLDYAAGTPMGYLIEPAATNLLQQSGSQGNAYWFASGVSVTATNISDPAGGTTASTLNMGNGVGPAGAVWADHVTVSANTAYTFSAWVKSSASGGGSFIRLTTNNASAFSTGISQRFPVTSTWTRISITGNVSNATVANIGFDNRDVTGTYDGTVSGNIDVWGAQLELGSTLTSYIPTTTATVTRGADVASFTLNSSATQLTFTFDDSSTQVITGLTGGSTYSIPTNLNRPRILFIDDDTIVSTSVNAVVNQTLGALTTTATAQVIAAATVNQTLGALGQSFASTVIDAATTAQTLGALQQTLAATIPDTAAVAQTLDALSQAATAISLSVLNPADKDPSITLSGGNLTGTATASGTHVIVRGTWPGSANRYFEVVWSTLASVGAQPGIGLANSSKSLTGYLGSDTNAIGWFSDGFFADTAGTSAITGYGVGDVLGVEELASSVKLYKNGTLITTTSNLPSGSLFPALDVLTSGDSATFNFGASALSYLPTGDTSWDGSQTSGTSTAVVAQTLGDLVQTTPAAVTVAGVVAQTLGALSQTATATAIDTASVAQTLGALTQTATATVKVAAAVAQTLGALGQTTTATVQVATVVAQTLGALSQSLAAAVTDAATVAQTLGTLGQTATAAATDTATTSQTLGDLNQTATAIHQAASAVVDQTLGALGQTATAAATDTAAVAQTLGALQQAVTAAAAVTATTAQTLGALQQLASTQVTDTATFQDNLGALQQTATGAVQVNTAVTQLLGNLGQTATVAVVGQAVVDQVLPGLDQNFFSSQSAHATVAQTLGDLAQAATGTVDVTAAIAQTLGRAHSANWRNC
jgi:hypothetical protein